MGLKKNVERMAEKPDTLVCPKCGYTNDTRGARTLQVEMRPVLTQEVFAFPDALAEVHCLRCTQCGYCICLDYRIELDDNPEMDLNPD
jgi:rubrerythrin